MRNFWKRIVDYLKYVVDCLYDRFQPYVWKDDNYTFRYKLANFILQGMLWHSYTSIHEKLSKTTVDAPEQELRLSINRLKHWDEILQIYFTRGLK